MGLTLTHVYSVLPANPKHRQGGVSWYGGVYCLSAQVVLRLCERWIGMECGGSSCLSYAARADGVAHAAETRPGARAKDHTLCGHEHAKHQATARSRPRVPVFLLTRHVAARKKNTWARDWESNLRHPVARLELGLLHGVERLLAHHVAHTRHPQRIDGQHPVHHHAAMVLRRRRS